MKYELIVDGVYILGLDDFTMLFDYAIKMGYMHFTITRDQVEYLTYEQENCA